jgi:hypothetical protein
MRTRRTAAALLAVAAVGLLVAQPAAARARRASYAFAPYINLTQYPAPNLVRVTRQSGVRQISLGFVTALKGSACTPAWGGYASFPASGAQAYEAAGVAAFQAHGGQAVPSFGGEAGAELATVCSSVAPLEQAYASVIATYHARRADFDIEGRDVDDPAATALRDQALAALQRADGVHVSFTLPALPSGLPSDSLAVVRDAVSVGVRLSYINLMTMDYGRSAAPHPKGRMADYAISAARRAAAQLKPLFPNLGVRARLRMLGLTPMIGINDVSAEHFTLADARRLASYARGRVGLVSMWELGRDRRCARPTRFAVDTCSGVGQHRYAFARALEGRAGGWGQGARLTDALAR